eukprot:7209507-Pyramimonas_sp.AAC.2
MQGDDNVEGLGSMGNREVSSRFERAALQKALSLAIRLKSETTALKGVIEQIYLDLLLTILNRIELRGSVTNASGRMKSCMGKRRGLKYCVM